MILVTGASGNVGAATLSACASLGLEAVGADRHGPHRRFDFTAPDTWPAAVAGCTRLLLLRPPPLSDMKRTLIPFVDFARSQGVGHVIFVSVQGAESKSYIPHFAVERHLERSIGPFTFLRPGFFAQNFVGAYRRDIVDDDRLYVPAGDGAVAFVDVRDIGLAAARIFAAPTAHLGQAHHLTGPRAFTFEEAALVLSEVLGRPIRYVPANAVAYLWHLHRRRQLVFMQAVIQTSLHLGLRRGDAAQPTPALGQLLGRPPRSLADFIRDAAAEWKR